MTKKVNHEILKHWRKVVMNNLKLNDDELAVVMVSLELLINGVNRHGLDELDDEAIKAYKSAVELKDKLKNTYY